jgi:hypothetical protein
MIQNTDNVETHTDGDIVLIYDRELPDAWLKSDYAVEVQ